MKAICWVRRDLRLTDHAALARATSITDQVAVVFVFDPNILDRLADRDDRRVTFIHQCLTEMDTKLRAAGSKLWVLHGDPVNEIPRVARELGVELVIAARDYEPYAVARDASVEAELERNGVRFETAKDTVIFEAGEIFGQAGKPLRVYTPYSKVWRSEFVASIHAAEHEPDLSKLVQDQAIDMMSLEQIGFTRNDPWMVAGEAAGNDRLNRFADDVDAYAEHRDFPALDATSGLSAHLRFGTVSIRAAVRMALERGTKGADKWLAELIWRDFYQDILGNNPHVISRPFNSLYDDIAYPGKDDHLVAWTQGMTGYPIVDAAMRCLVATGWMHNRLRMVVASFLTKDLLIDYRCGEAFFARYLLDFDLASNNGGWQWAASVGCDAQPYFRIFNPLLQSLKFDPEGAFIRKWIPELAGLASAHIHAPHEVSHFDLAAAGIELGTTYPTPIVNHAIQKQLAIQLLERK